MVRATSAASHSRVPSAGIRYAAISARAGTSSSTTSSSSAPMVSGSVPSRGGTLPVPAGIDPKYFSAHASVCSGSMSPTTASTALFGA